MASQRLFDTATSYLHHLCLDIPSRAVGSPGNREATAFFARTVAGFGFETECPEFDCMDWSEDGADLHAGGAAFDAFVSPYSLPCHAFAPLAVASTVDELEAAEATGSVLLLKGGLAREQLMPKNFPFYNPDEHQRIIRLLEAKQPAAIVAATARNPEMAGALYPFPMFEDGDFDIPSVYMTDEAGEALARHAGRQVSLDIRAERRPARGCNSIARKGDMAHRVVVFAHIDAKASISGAIDNASGVVTLLLLAESLAGYAGGLGIELVAMNGEDYYSNPGEQDYLARNAGRFGEIVLGLNIDGAGYRRGGTAYSLYDCPAGMDQAIRAAFSAHAGMVEGEPWYQGDHGLFLLNQRPALAVTSERVLELMSQFVHTPRDSPEIVDCGRLVTIASALHEILLKMG
jgi:aminopeptidase YwaD